MLRALALALAALLLALTTPSVAAAQVDYDNPTTSTPTTLYFHLIDGNNDFPINTQVPSDEWRIAPGQGIATHSTSCLPPVPGSPLVSAEWHTWYGYSSPSEVEYAYQEDGRPRVHPERGLSFDVRLDTAAQPVLYWYLETQGPLDQGSAAPLVVPNVVVQATMRTGSAIGIGDENYAQGEVLASGRTDPSTLAGEATGGPATYLGGERPTYMFPVPLELQTDTFPSDTGFNVRVDVFLDNPACGDGYVMPNTVRLHTAPGERPRMELATLNPLVVETLHPQMVGDDLVVHILANSPWGSYDVDEHAFTVRIDGPTPDPGIEVYVTTHIHDHGPTAHFQPVAVAAIWRDAGPGLYKIGLVAHNDQHTAEATASTEFAVGADPEREGRMAASLHPVVVWGGAAALVAVAAAAVVAYRRLRGA